MSKVHVAMTRRSAPDGLRAFAAKETSALFTRELGRRQNEWRGVLESVKHTLADLEATCDLMSTAPAAPADAVAELSDRIAAAAAADAEAVARQIEAQAEAESASARALVDQLQAAVRASEEQLRTARAELDVEHSARARAESASKAAQVAHEQAIAALEVQVRGHEAQVQTHRAEVAALQQQIEAGQTERANLMATLEAVQRAVRRAVSAFEPPQSGPLAPAPPPTPHRKAGNEPTLVLVTPAPVASAHVDAPSSNTSAEPDRRLSNVELRAGGAGINDYVTTLLETTEAMYWEDVNLALPPYEVLDRLTSNLRHASSLFTARLGSGSAGERSVFMNQVMTLVDTKSATSFGRHLSIAAYETEQHVAAHAVGIAR